MISFKCFWNQNRVTSRVVNEERVQCGFSLSVPELEIRKEPDKVELEMEG